MESEDEVDKDRNGEDRDENEDENMEVEDDNEGNPPLTGLSHLASVSTNCNCPPPRIVSYCSHPFNSKSSSQLASDGGNDIVTSQMESSGSGRNLKRIREDLEDDAATSV